MSLLIVIALLIWHISNILPLIRILIIQSHFIPVQLSETHLDPIQGLWAATGKSQHCCPPVAWGRGTPALCCACMSWPQSYFLQEISSGEGHAVICYVKWMCMHRVRGKPANQPHLDAKAGALREGKWKQITFKSRSFSTVQVVLECDCEGFVTAWGCAGPSTWMRNKPLPFTVLTCNFPIYTHTVWQGLTSHRGLCSFHPFLFQSCVPPCLKERHKKHAHIQVVQSTPVSCCWHQVQDADSVPAGDFHGKCEQIDKPQMERQARAGSQQLW